MTKGAAHLRGISEQVAIKHDAIRRRYEELREKEMAENPVRASFLPRSYYIELISCDPIIGLSRNYILSILNHYSRRTGKSGRSL